MVLLNQKLTERLKMKLHLKPTTEAQLFVYQINSCVSEVFERKKPITEKLFLFIRLNVISTGKMSNFLLQARGCVDIHA